MESLVSSSYCSDEEETESYSENLGTNTGQRGMDTVSRQGDEDTNYDNVQMDMSEESNNNDSPDRTSSHSEESSDSEKTSVSSTRSHSQKSSASSDGSPRGCNLGSQSVNVERCPSKDSPSHSKRLIDSADSTAKQAPGQENRDREHVSDHRKESRSSRDYNTRHDRERDKEHGHRDTRALGHGKEHRGGRRSEGSRGKEHRCSPPSRERERHHSRSGKVSPDRKRGRVSHSRSPPVYSHTSSRHSDSSSSRSSKDSHRTRSRSRDRGAASGRRSHSKERGPERRRSHSKERQRSRSRERRRSYEKKPNKLTILERLGIELRPPDMSPAVTPQLLLQRSMEQQVNQVKNSTGIELPKYYNPAAMNPVRYAEQMQKRKLLWGNKSGNPEGANEPKPLSNNKWEGTTFAQDQDGKMTAKFKRLMGIKDGGQGSGAGHNSSVDSNELLKKQEELFNSMEMQYEVARVATHTHRGLGLGFGTFQYPR